jgi:formylglycine-generating enzyme required for sulfatase activity
MKREILFSNTLPVATVCIVMLITSAQAGFQWSKRIASTTDTDTEFAIGMALDANGNCYVTGWFDGTNDFGGVTLTNNNVGGQDIFVAKYNSAGALQWAQLAGGSSANEDVGRGLGVDANGNVYVTGGFYSPANFGGFDLPVSPSENFFLTKYNNAGTVQWVQQGVGGQNVYGTGLAVDSAGNSYALAFANNSDTITFGATNLSTPGNYGESTLLIKYDNTGTVQWAQLIGGSGETYATGIAVDAAGYVYVNGSFTENMTIGTSNLVSIGSTKNVFFAKFDNSGKLIWVQQPQGDVGNLAGGGVAIDRAENVYFCGMFDTMTLNFGDISLTNAGSSYDAFVAKYDSSGAMQWVRQTGGTNLDSYGAVALDDQGNIDASGTLNSDAAIAKYDSAGTLQWAYSASGSPANPVPSLVENCAVDSVGNCYLAGWYQGTNTFGTNTLQPQGYWNFFLAKVSAPAPPTLGIVFSNGFPQLSLAGDIGSMYSLEWSPAMTATNTLWQTLMTFTLTDSPQFFQDANATSGINRFYQAAPPQLYQSSTNANTTLIAVTNGMALIPAGSFQIGDTLDGESDAIPTNVYISAFYMDTNLVSYSQWQLVYNWAIKNGYGGFDYGGSAKAANNPVKEVDWYDVVKWCNARSQQAGLAPVYYTDAGLTQVYTNGDTDAVYPNWTASGYRLPTEAEWEKAARGGQSGLRFPWGDTISESQANYYGDTNDWSYDFGPNGYNSIGSIGGTDPATSPVGYFSANGYGLHDMSGNVEEWCWDWYDDYLSSIGSPYAGGTDPHGPASSPYDIRVLRGGDWGDYDGIAYYARCASRNAGESSNDTNGGIGFRCVRGL